MILLTIAIPTYEEVANIEALLVHIAAVSAREPDARITALVVDDASPDGTADVARSVGERLATERFDVRVLERAGKSGLGTAYVAAFTKLLSGADVPDFVMQMDADGSHDPEYISQFLAAAAAGADFVVASRYIPGGGTPDWTWDRKLLSRGGNFYSRLLLGRRITDYTGGFNMYSSALLRRLDVTTIPSTGYGFQIVLKYRALRVARLVREIPIVFMDRTEGESKIPKDTLRKNLVLVFEMRFLGRHR